LLLGCASAPQTSTLEQRAMANTILVNAETIVLGLRVAGELNEADATLALAQIAEVRALVTSSEHVGMDWATVMQRAVNIGLQWVPAKSTPQ
jgi:hypothetical protein